MPQVYAYSTSEYNAIGRASVQRILYSFNKLCLFMLLHLCSKALAIPQIPNTSTLMINQYVIHVCSISQSHFPYLLNFTLTSKPVCRLGKTAMASCMFCS